MTRPIARDGRGSGRLTGHRMPPRTRRAAGGAMARRRMRDHLMTPGSAPARAGTVGCQWLGRSGAGPSRSGISTIVHTETADSPRRARCSSRHSRMPLDAAPAFAGAGFGRRTRHRRGGRSAWRTHRRPGRRRFEDAGIGHRDPAREVHRERRLGGGATARTRSALRASRTDPVAISRSASNAPGTGLGGRPRLRTTPGEAACRALPPLPGSLGVWWVSRPSGIGCLGRVRSSPLRGRPGCSSCRPRP